MYPLFTPSTFSYMTRREVNGIFGISIYTITALGYSSNLIGSLSLTMTLYSPRLTVNIKQNKIARVNEGLNGVVAFTVID